MKKNRNCLTGLLIVLAAHFPQRLSAAEVELGLQGKIGVADGEPANDIMASGLFARYRLNDSWAIGVALDRAEYDFERPWKVIGVEQSHAQDAVDATVKSTQYSVWLQREWSPTDASWRWFGRIGLGTASPAIGRITGPTESGGTFDIRTDAKRENIVSAVAGFDAEWSEQWAWEIAFRADHHLADWKVADHVSGNQASVRDYTVIGLHAAIIFKF